MDSMAAAADTLRLDGIPTIARAEAFIDQLAPALDGDGLVQLDCSDSTDADLSVIQIPLHDVLF